MCAAPGQADEQKAREWQGLVRWLILAPFVLLLLYSCGMVSTLGLKYPPAQAVYSKLTAEYSPWEYVFIPALDERAIELLRQEGLPLPTELVIPGEFWLGPTATPRPVPQPTKTQEPTERPLPTLPPSTETVPAQPYPTTATDSYTPTRTATKTTILPSATSTCTVSYPPTTSTHTSSPIASITSWPTFTPTTTPTVLASASPTATQFWPPTQTSTTIPATQTWTPTASPIPTLTLTPTTAPPTATTTQTPTPTATRTATITPTYTQTPPLVITPTPTTTPPPVITLTFTPTETPTPTSTSTPTSTPPPTLTPTLTSTPTLTPTPTTTLSPTSTPTRTRTPTNTPIPCGGNMPPGEPDIGPPDGIFAELPCGGLLILDLVAMGYPPIDTTSQDPDYDVVYYERENTGNPGYIAFDWVTMQVGPGPSGSCNTSSWYTALDWGDGNPANNGHLGAGYPENDNQAIPLGVLYGTLPYKTGIAIDLDALVPADVYPCIRIISPINWPNNDGAEVDAIEILGSPLGEPTESDDMVTGSPAPLIPERQAPQTKQSKSVSSLTHLWWLIGILLLPILGHAK